MDRSLDQLRRRLLIHCTPSQADTAAEIATAHDTGLVVTGASADTIAHRLREKGFDGPILCDADRYSGPRRVDGGRGIHPAWCRRQQELGLVPLTDSGYLEPDNWNALRSILRVAALQRRPVIAMLPLAARWFAESHAVDDLARELDSYGVAVAVAIEHASDPFSVQYVVRHFLHLLRTTQVPVLLLRSDVSALGALCHGAFAAATGTTSSLRHIYPLTSKGIPRAAFPAVFIRHLLSYHRLDTCETVFARTPETSHFWLCDCVVCGGTTPDRLHDSDDQYSVALRHSLHAQLLLHDEIFRHTDTPDQRASAWHEACSHALFVHRQVAEHVPDWRTPAHLKSWHTVTDDPLRGRAGIPAQPTQRSVLFERPAEKPSVHESPGV